MVILTAVAIEAARTNGTKSVSQMGAKNEGGHQAPHRNGCVTMRARIAGQIFVCLARDS